MSILDPITSALGSRKTSYICRFCRLTFERERRNCPACGCGTVEPDR